MRREADLQRRWPHTIGACHDLALRVAGLSEIRYKSPAKSSMIDTLPDAAITKRKWNGRDDIRCNFFGRIPLAEPVVTLTLTWKRDRESRPQVVGKFRLDMPKLVSTGYARKVPGWYVLRCQRTGNRIEVAINRSCKAFPLPPGLHHYTA